MADNRVNEAVEAIAAHTVAIDAEVIARRSTDALVRVFPEFAGHADDIRARIVTRLELEDSGVSAATAAAAYLLDNPKVTS